MLISNEAFKYFLEGCINNGGKLKFLELVGMCKLNQEYFDIAKRLGVQLINHV